MISPQLHSFMASGFRKRKAVNFLFCGMIVIAAGLALAALFYVFGYVVYQGLPSLNLAFFVEIPKPVGESGGGMANALVGTAVLVLMASLIGIPWGVFTGVYLSEYGQGKLGSFVRFCTDMMTSVPSIIMGLFVYVLLVLPMKRFSAIAGSVALAFIMVPIVARTTEELLRLVPVHIREAGLALGLPRWKVTLRIVLRGTLSGIMSGVMLAVARVAGETAPLLFTALGNNYWQQGLDQPIASLPVQIYNYAIAPFEDLHRQAWAGALVLVLFVFALNLVTRLVLRPSSSGARD
jgi:phosphate transport system permease protein